jgi:hydroxymethylpyrimidine/phosphomethylpyrimidine kinase
VITGQELRPGFVSDLTYHSKTGKTEIYETEMYPGHYHGTGDLFASAFIGALVNGLSYPASIKIAHDYVHQAIKNNARQPAGRLTLRTGIRDGYSGFDPGSSDGEEGVISLANSSFF